MPVTSDTALTKYVSAVTIVTADVANSWYGGLHGSEEAKAYEGDHPLVSGHVHDGMHADGHAQKINLVSHVTSQLRHVNLADDAVSDRNVNSFLDVENAIPVFEYDRDGVTKLWKLDLSMYPTFSNVNLHAYSSTDPMPGTVSGDTVLSADSGEDALNIYASNGIDFHGVDGTDNSLRITNGAEVFRTIAFQSGNIQADILHDTLTVAGIGGIYVSGDPATKTMTIDGSGISGGLPAGSRYMVQYNTGDNDGDGNDEFGADAGFLYYSPENNSTITGPGLQLNNFWDNTDDVGDWNRRAYISFGGHSSTDPSGTYYSGAALASIHAGRVSEFDTGNNYKGGLLFRTNTGSPGPGGAVTTPAMGIDSQSFVGIGTWEAFGSGGVTRTKRRLHVKGNDDEIILRLNNLYEGTGKMMVWEANTGDVYWSEMPIVPAMPAAPSDPTKSSTKHTIASDGIGYNKIVAEYIAKGADTFDFVHGTDTISSDVEKVPVSNNPALGDEVVRLVGDTTLTVAATYDIVLTDVSVIPNIFKWRKNNEAYTNNVAINLRAGNAFVDGLKAYFSKESGFMQGDSFTFTVDPTARISRATTALNTGVAVRRAYTAYQGEKENIFEISNEGRTSNFKSFLSLNGAMPDDINPYSGVLFNNLDNNAANPKTYRGAAILSRNDTSDETGNLEFYTNKDGGLFPRKSMVISSSGDLGLGTDSPLANLDVSAPSAAIRISALESPWKSAIEFVRGSTTFGSDNYTDYRILAEGGSLTIDSGHASTGVDTRLSIGSDGNIGIGTESPEQELDFHNCGGFHSKKFVWGSAGTVTVMSIDITKFRSAKVFLTAKDTTNSEFLSTEVTLMHDGTNSYVNEYGRVQSLQTLTSGMTLSGAISGGNLVLSFTTTGSNAGIGSAIITALSGDL